MNFGYYNVGFDLFYIIFFIILCVFIFNFTISIKKYLYNEKQPVLDVRCRVVSKRTNFTKRLCHTDANGIHHSGATKTIYYVTFEFESTDRMEFEVSGKEFGMIAEGDIGVLKFQGTRYLDFKRDVK